MKFKSMPSGGPSDKERLKTATGLSLKKLLLPDVYSFRAFKGKIDKLMESIGLERVLKRSFSVTKHRNARANRYLKTQFTRLHKYAKAGEGTKFEALSKLLEKRSKAMMALFIFRVFPHWYKEFSTENLKRLVRRLKVLIRTESASFSYRRVAIPKPDGTQRDLAVPKKEWRVLMNWKYTILYIWCEGTGTSMDGINFGSYPGKSVINAWDRIMSLRNKKFIYEFDLRSFFDQINWFAIWNVLKELKYPYEMSHWLLRMLKYSTGQLSTERYKELYLLSRKRQATDLKRAYQVGGWGALWRELVDHLLARSDERRYLEMRTVLQDVLKGEEVNYENKDTVSTMIRICKSMGEFKFKQIFFDSFVSMRFRKTGPKALWYVEDALLKDSPLNIGKGVPQGNGISPLLALLSLTGIYKKYGDKLVMYMDDGLLFSDDPIDMLQFEEDLKKEVGVTLNWKKTSVVKADGIWKTDLNFLGFNLRIGESLPEGSTRNGSKVKFPDLKALREFTFKGESYRNWWLAEKKKLDDWNLLGSLDVWGFMLSLLYGSPTTKDKKQEKKVKRNAIVNTIKYSSNIINNSSILLEELFKVLRASK